MSDELKAAAERLRKHYACYSVCDSPYFLPEISMINMPLLDCDEKDVSQAYLAEHPADDGEPITKEWLLSIGSAYHSVLHQFAIGKYGQIRILFWPRANRCEWFLEVLKEMIEIPRQSTRGQFRRLLSALGINGDKPKESGS